MTEFIWFLFVALIIGSAALLTGSWFLFWLANHYEIADLVVTPKHQVPESDRSKISDCAIIGVKLQ